ncbi:HD domain-containing protein [Herbiconiux liukaitaii]|uniref:HD domain-containing protein n=1 Tax=Herbiconiux liukaitaii TaxID=3342799 RepID=UPI0035B7DE00
MTFDFTTTSLWQRTLGEQTGDDPDREAREKLRASYLQMREAVEPLANEISQSMPSFTVHSIDHCDALWQMGSLLMPSSFDLNPAEAYVLGASFLIHDLGMGLSAYEHGEVELREDPLFKDLVAQAVNRHTTRAGLPPTKDELTELETRAIVTVLRRRHAKQAERLVARSFKTTHSDSLYLIEKTDLRHAWGSLIGKIAHSHWIDVDDLASELSQVKGSPSGYPVAWEVDPLKIACALRLADACHVDGDRAPTYLSAVRPVDGDSADHWYFQERLNQPRLEQGRVVYTANVDFDAEHAQQWWLAYETSRMISTELQRVDALCQDLNRPRFAAQSVAGADSPERFRSYVGVDGWTPVDAGLKVSSVEDLAASLGGKNLYGDQPRVPIRELIANAADALRARIAQYSVTSDATIYVSVDEQKDGRWWLTVEDHGIGMSADRILSSLTDFGRSGWTSEDVLDDYPGLVSKGYQSIGRFGVGFYSAFMVADLVEVRTLKYRGASRETSVLIFPAGLSRRPLLRAAHEREEIHVGGTVVRLRLKEQPLSRNGLLQAEEVDGSISEMFVTVLKSMCALLEFSVEFRGPGDTDFTSVVRGGDWKVSSPQSLFETAYAHELRPASNSSIGWAYLSTVFAQNARDLSDGNGDIVGRASLSFSDDLERVPWWTSHYARVYIGGLEAGHIFGVLGVFVGEPLRADRLRGFPSASQDELRRWASEQAQFQPAGNAHGTRAQQALSLARGLGATLEDHPVAYVAEGHLTPRTLGQWLESIDRVVIVPSYELDSYVSDTGLKLLDREHGHEVRLPENAIYGHIVTDWIFPEEVHEYPRDDRFKPYGDLESGTFNARYWWHTRAALGFPAALLDGIVTSWGMTTDEVADATSEHRLSHKEDTRLELPTSSDQSARVDAIEVVRKRP